jgi:hypothetical protein
MIPDPRRLHTKMKLRWRDFLRSGSGSYWPSPYSPDQALAIYQRWISSAADPKSPWGYPAEKYNGAYELLSATSAVGLRTVDEVRNGDWRFALEYDYHWYEGSSWTVGVGSEQGETVEDFVQRAHDELEAYLVPLAGKNAQERAAHRLHLTRMVAGWAALEKALGSPRAWTSADLLQRERVLEVLADRGVDGLPGHVWHGLAALLDLPPLQEEAHG